MDYVKVLLFYKLKYELLIFKISFNQTLFKMIKLFYKSTININSIQVIFVNASIEYWIQKREVILNGYIF